MQCNIAAMFFAQWVEVGLGDVDPHANFYKAVIQQNYALNWFIELTC